MRDTFEQQGQNASLHLAGRRNSPYTAPVNKDEQIKRHRAREQARRAHPPKLGALKRFERYVDQAYGFDFSSPRGLRRARWHFNWIDHAALRALWPNVAPVAEGVWRSGHPSIKRLEWFHAMGVNTVLNLRGSHKRSHYYFEKTTTDRLGMTLVDISLSARNLVPAPTMLKLLDIFETIDHPFVLHCKSGADRAGLVSALYLIHMKDMPIAQARKQLSPRFLHFRRTSTGILDFMLDAFEKDVSTTPMTLRQWFDTKYDPEALTRAFKASRKHGGPAGT